MTAPTPRCGRAMRRYEAVHGALLEDPVCGRPVGHNGPCRSVQALARLRAVRSAQPPGGSVEAGRRLRAAREEAGLSQRTLARLLGVQQRSVWAFERGERHTLPVRLDILLRMLRLVASSTYQAAA